MSTSGPGTLCVVVTTRNDIKSIGRTLRSIKRQRGVSFCCALVDDRSDDGTWKRAHRLVGKDPRFTLLRPPEPSGALVCRMLGIRSLGDHPQDIVVNVEAPGRFARRDALLLIARCYTDPAIWLTYGNVGLPRDTWRLRLRRRRKLGIKNDYPESILRLRLFRYRHMLATHLRTYRRFLFDAIRDEDLRTRDGAYVRSATELVTMVPMMEMAGPGHIRFGRQIYYIYPRPDERDEASIRTNAFALDVAKSWRSARYAPCEVEKQAVARP